MYPSYHNHLHTKYVDLSISNLGSSYLISLISYPTFLAFLGFTRITSFTASSSCIKVWEVLLEFWVYVKHTGMFTFFSTGMSVMFCLMLVRSKTLPKLLTIPNAPIILRILR